MDALAEPRDAPSPPDVPDANPTETGEWLDALLGVVRAEGGARGAFLLARLEERARELGIFHRLQPCSPYVNTIPPERQLPYPGDLALEARVTAILRWNALAMVARANEAHGDLGGHIASYTSAAEIFETGFHHFFHAPFDEHGGDLVFFQPHSAPGIYARAFLEGRLSEAQLARYRQEVGGRGLCSTLLYEVTRGPPGRRLEPACEPVAGARFLVAPHLIAASLRNLARRERPT